jgi:cytochrome c oxidase cbb3-type subunit 3
MRVGKRPGTFTLALLSAACAGVLALAPAASAAQQPDTQYRPGPKPDPAAVARGQKLFLTNCSFCHAADATGASGPDLLRSPVVLRDQRGESIGPVVHGGRPSVNGGPAMPPFTSLSDSQIADISAFLRSRIQAAADRFDYDIAGLQTGNAQQGKAYFNGPGQCSTCHTDTAGGQRSLAGIASRLTAPQLLKRIVYPSPAAGSAPETVTVTLPGGQTVTGELIHDGEFNVVLRDADGWQRTIAKGPGVRAVVKDPLEFHKEQIGKYTDAELHNLLSYMETLK